MPGKLGGTGSTATELAERVRRVFYFYRTLLPEDQTSARFNVLWGTRGTVYRDNQLHYNFNTGRWGDNSSGWFNYHKSLYGSSYNTLNTTGRYAPTGVSLPSAPWRDFSTRVPGLTTLGITDAAIGRNVWTLYQTQVYQSEGFELLLAWAGRGLNTSANILSSVELG